MITKQTAVEWLEDNLIGNPFSEKDFHNVNMFKKAKEIEKQQMIEFANSFYDDCVMEGGSLQQSAEEHYNETYKQQKKGNKCFECNNDKGNNELYCSFCRNQN